MIKKKKYRKNILVFIFVLLLIISFIFNKKLKETFYYISSPIQKYFWSIGGEIYGIFEKKNEILELRKENALLLYQAKQLDFYIKENEELKKVLNIDNYKDIVFNYSKIIGRKDSEDILLIDKGKKDGILENMPVITTDKIAVGKITKTYDYFSEVSLLSKKDFTIDVLLPEDVFAVAKGLGNYNVAIEMIPSDNLLEEGDIIITSAMGGVFPEGFLVGKIKDIKKNDTDFYMNSMIDLFFNINSSKDLLIINKPIL